MKCEYCGMETIKLFVKRIESVMHYMIFIPHDIWFEDKATSIVLLK